MPTSTTALASERVAPQSGTRAVAAAPPQYVPWPSELAQHEAISRLGGSVLSARMNVPFCLTVLSEQQADSAHFDNPRNQMLYQIQAYCFKGATVGTITTSWQGRGLNATAEVTHRDVVDTCTDHGPDPWSFGRGRKCFSDVKTVPLVSGHAEYNVWTKVVTELHYNGHSYAYLPLANNPMYASSSRFSTISRCLIRSYRSMTRPARTSRLPITFHFPRRRCGIAVVEAPLRRRRVARTCCAQAKS
jgi:hypothetical protein